MSSSDTLAASWEGLQRHDRLGFEVPDPIGFADLHLAFHRGMDAPPLPTETFPIPKRGGVRSLALLDPSEHVRFRALVGRLAPRIERALGEEAVANRVWACRGGPGAGGLWLEPWRRARRRYAARITALRSSGPRFLVLADVRDCYARIRPDVVAGSLGRLGCSAGEVDPLAEVLGRFEARGISGLPVGPEPSAVLANAVLLGLDVALARRSLRHVRWVDDVTIGARSQAEAASALEAVHDALADLRLEPAEEKCHVVEAAAREPRPTAPPAGPSASPRATDRGHPESRQLTRLESPATDERALEEVDLLRRAAVRRWGRSEAALLLHVARDHGRHRRVRAWAWIALGGTDPATCRDAAAASSDEPCPAIRRAVVIAAARAGGRGTISLLRHVRRRHEDLSATVDWALWHLGSGARPIPDHTLIHT